MLQRNLSASRLQVFGFLVIYAIIFTVIIIKAFTLPMTHDEAWTVISYVKHNPWDIMMYPDEWPNNHILNTLLAKFSCWIFGVHDWSARLPNLLFFPVYTWGVYRLLRATLSERMYLFLPAALLFVLSPYFLDFFGLCRGYGISSGFTMLSLSFFVTGFVQQKSKHIWWAVLLAILASYANFTALVYWAAAMCVAGLYFMIAKRNWKDCFKNWGVLFVIGIGYIALIATPIYKMKSTDQFQYWTSQGFYQDTVFSVVNNSLSDSRVFTRPDWISKIVVLSTLILLCVVVILLVRFRFKKTGFQQPLVIVGIVLTATIGINLLQTTILGDPNLNGRTALFLLPLYTALVAAGFILIPKGRLKGIGHVFAGLIVLIALQHLTTTTRMNSFKEWRYDAFTFEVFDYVKENGGEEVRVDMFWLYHNSMVFYKKYERYPWLITGPYNKEVDSLSTADFYYIPAEHVATLEPRFKKVKVYHGGGTLMKRRD